MRSDLHGQLAQRQSDERCAAKCAGFRPLVSVTVRAVGAECLSAFTASTAVSFAITSTWATGYNGEITVTNNGEAAVNGWTLEFDFTGAITNLWNATLVSQVGTHYIVQNAGYNAAIAVGGSVAVGFSANPADQAQPPTNYIFNGVAVGGSTSNPTITTTLFPAARSEVTIRKL